MRFSKNSDVAYRVVLSFSRGSLSLEETVDRTVRLVQHLSSIPFSAARVTNALSAHLADLTEVTKNLLRDELVESRLVSSQEDSLASFEISRIFSFVGIYSLLATAAELSRTRKAGFKFSRTSDLLLGLTGEFRGQAKWARVDAFRPDVSRDDAKAFLSLLADVTGKGRSTKSTHKASRHLVLGPGELSDTIWNEAYDLVYVPLRHRIKVELSPEQVPYARTEVVQRLVGSEDHRVPLVFGPTRHLNSPHVTGRSLKRRLLSGSPNLIQDVVFHALSHPTQPDVWVDGADLWTGKTLYHSQPAVVDAGSKLEKFTSLGRHDLLANFWLAKFLAQHPRARFSQKLVSVLAQTPIEYLRMVEDRFYPKRNS